MCSGCLLLDKTNSNLKKPISLFYRKESLENPEDINVYTKAHLWGVISHVLKMLFCVICLLQYSLATYAHLF